MRFNQVRKFVKALDRVMMILCCATVAAIAGITCVDGLGRYLFNRPIAPAYEITEMYLVVVVVFLSMGFVYKEKGHVDIDLITKKLPKSVQDIVEKFNALLTLVLFLLIAVAGWRVGIRKIRAGAVMSSIDIPTGPAYFLVVVGSIFLMYRLIETIFSKQQKKSMDEDE
jgi:TRAP-type C4-dicarboxylate transport system permease small subunit